MGDTAATDTMADNKDVGGGGGESQHNARMVAIRTQFPHTSGQLVSL